MKVHAFSNINITFVGGMNPGSVKFLTVSGLIKSLVTYCCQIWRSYLDRVGTLIRSLVTYWRPYLDCVGTLIRSLVTYCCQIWRPYLIKESRTLEKLQRRASKYIMGYPSLDYKQRLLRLNLLPLTL